MATKSAAATKIAPLADRVVVKALEESETMRGGLYIPDTAKEKPQQGEIIAVGPGRTEDGKRVEMGAGEISLGDDQHSRVDAQGRRGHRSGTVGGEPAKLMIVQLAEPPAAGPCPFK